MSVIQVIEQLRTTSARNEKIAILTKNKTSNLVKVLRLALDPYHSFYEKKFKSLPTESEEYDEDEVIDILYSVFCSDNRKDIAVAIDNVMRMCNSVEEKIRDFWKSVISQDIDCGIGASSVNKALGPTIAEYKLMKAEDREGLDELKPPYYVQQKVDASRCNIVCTGMKVTVHSSSGTPYPNMSHIKAAVRLRASTIGVDNFVIDGELIKLNDDGSEVDRATSNGKANKALNGNLSLSEESSFVLKAFDLVDYQQFLDGYSATPYHERLARLCDEFGGCPGIHILPSEEVDDLNRVMELYHESVAKGQEGIMVKECDMPYEGKRSSHMVKLKKEFEIDLKIVGHKPHKKNDNMIGSIELQDHDGKINGSVGTKMSDQDRVELKKLLDAGELYDKITTVRIHDVSVKKVKGGQTYSLYLPRFIELRNDKFVADGFDRIMKIIKPAGE